ncbi:MAG: HlyD family efflux transporter periplasmic adaptor subunit [bacterium]|nr:HlyD family efflux transporter periplasmic adaptor subunit [bacterium]
MTVLVRSLRPIVPRELPRPRRGFPWARAILIVTIIALCTYVLLPRYLNLIADGLVEGDLIPIAPLFRARIERSFVQCDQVVREGQPLAAVTNFLLEGQYAQDYQKAVDDLRAQQIAQSEGLAQARIAEATALERYQSSVYDARKLEIMKDAYEQTYRQGAIGRLAFESARADWNAAKAESNGLRDIWSQAREHSRRIQAENAQRVAGYANEVALLGDLKSQVHSQTLGAPVRGRVVECAAQPQAIVDAGTPIYKIFAPNRAYILAFFAPNVASSIHVGEPAKVYITGFPAPVAGNVTAIYPSLAKLPDQLTKYFWQHQQWSEYRPVKIVLSQVRRNVRERLTYDAQVRVEIRRRALTWQEGVHEVGLR